MAILSNEGTRLEGLPKGKEGLVSKELDELKAVNDKVVKELFEGAEVRNGLPCVSSKKIDDILKANGFINPLSP